MDFLKAVNIIGRDLEEAMALLEQISGLSGPEKAEIELARSRVRSASELLKLLPGMAAKVEPAPVTGTVDQVPAQEQSVKPTPKPVPAPQPEPEAVKRSGQETAKPILADRFSSAGTLGEKISTGRHDEVISTVIHSKPIEDIGAAIGMNDRFLYIRELFSGDTLAYNDTIRRLNAAASLGEAMRILDESTVMGSDPAAQSSFVDVVRRKFSLHV